MILGKGPRLEHLESVAKSLDVASDVDFPGFVPNPFPYVKESSVFALSSRWEGMPNVLLQALSLRTPVAATDCPSGPSEILQGPLERFLCPPGDEEALAKRLRMALTDPPEPEQLDSAISDYHPEKITDRYLDVLVG